VVVRAFQTVDVGATFTPLRFGLLSAGTIIDDPDPHWQLGTQFELDACGVPVAVTGGPCAATGITKVPTVTGSPNSAAEPFSVYAWQNCAPVGQGNDLGLLRRRTEALLTNGEGRAVEAVVWSGNAANGVIRPHLAEDSASMSDAQGATTVELQTAATVVTTGTALPLMHAMALVEAELAQCYGGEGVIHVPAAAALHLSNVGVVQRQGAQLRTLLGNVVAVYSSGNREGPTGSAPAAGQAWIYGTGAVFIRRSPIKGVGMRPADFVGRADNSTVYVVERTYVVDWACCHVAAQVEIPGFS
jgi:hypothetical protein